MPTNIDDKTGEQALNRFNISMRSQPWFVQWHRQHGLNPSGNGNRKLSGTEQNELEGLVVQNMFQGRKPQGMTIDSGGSLNQYGGWKGMPTWAKIAIIAGATVATAGAAGAFSGGAGAASGVGGGAGAATGTGATVGSTLALPSLVAVNSGAPIVAAGVGAGVGTGVGVGTGSTVASLLGTGLTTRQIVQSAITPGINAGVNYFTQRAQSRQADRALTAELSAQDRAAALQAQSAKDQLDFLKKSEADRLAEARRVEALNLGEYNKREDRLNPYRQLGLNALTRFGQPISVGSALGI